MLDEQKKVALLIGKAGKIILSKTKKKRKNYIRNGKKSLHTKTTD